MNKKMRAICAALLAGLATTALGQSPIVVTGVYLDGDGAGDFDDNIRIFPSIANGIDLIAPGGVEVTTGDLSVRSGGFLVIGGNTALTNIADAEAQLLLTNSSGGPSATAAVILKNAIIGGETRALELIGTGAATGADDLRVNVPTAGQLVFWSPSAAEAKAWIDNTDGFEAPTLRASDQLIVEGLGSALAPAIHFVEGTLPVDVGLYIEGPDGNFVLHSDSLDVLTANANGVVEVSQRLDVLNGSGGALRFDRVEFDTAGDAAQIVYNTVSSEFEATNIVGSPGFISTVDGNETTPAIRRSLDPDTGVFWGGTTDTINLAAAGDTLLTARRSGGQNEIILNAGDVFIEGEAGGHVLFVNQPAGSQSTFEFDSIGDRAPFGYDSSLDLFFFESAPVEFRDFPVLLDAPPTIQAPAISTVTLTADDQTVDVAGFAIIVVNDDNPGGGGAARTFTLTNTEGVARDLLLVCGTGNVQIVDNSGIGDNIVRLSGNFTFGDNDTLALSWVPALGVWVQTSESNN